MREPFAVLLALALLGVGPASAGAGAGAPAPSLGESNALDDSDGELRVTHASVQTQIACDFESLYDETIESVVTVRVSGQNASGLGSGFVYDESGHVVTNQHVVGNASEVEVQFDRGQWRTAEVVGTDAYSDLAVLRVGNAPDYADPLGVNASEPEPGQRVAAFGSPLGLQGTITDGIVSGTNRSMPAVAAEGPRFTIPNTIQTTAAINPGNSGGPLVNCAGAVVGVNTASAAGGENTGFAVPASRLKRVVPALIQNGSYTHSYLGITSTDVTPTVADANDLGVNRGVLVNDVVPGSPVAGTLRGSDDSKRIDDFEIPVGGDVILRVDGQRIASQEDLASVLTQKRPGDTVRMRILRDGERQRVRVTLGERPPPEEA
ncbi:S1C family serine protease [Halorussus amylolyticus]|uniref:S1C family serine protease n=1 Tax=Halorussus amylolyticus TaxID=1126242 RepID=UPI00105278AF|nr:trypsin-like peptidase domain-containing protein [Halorussus amylolyticus]